MKQFPRSVLFLLLNILVTIATVAILWLAGWQVTDEDGNLYQFPELLLQGGTIRLHSGAGRNTLPDLYWGLTAPVWESGETVTVIDSAGNVRTRAQLP